MATKTTHIHFNKAAPCGCCGDNNNNNGGNSGIQLPPGGQDGDRLVKNGDGLAWETPTTTTTSTSTTTTSTTSTTTSTTTTSTSTSTTSSTTTTTPATTTTSTTTTTSSTTSTTSSTSTTTPIPTFTAYWGWKSTNNNLTVLEIQALNASGSFQVNTSPTVDFRGGNALPQYLYYVEPISQPIKTSWFATPLRYGNIGLSPETFRVLHTIDNFRVYVSNFQTDFSTTTQFLL